MDSEIFQLFPDMPHPVMRCRIGELTNGAISPRTVANHDSKGTGPKGRFLINGKIAYSRDSFLEWLASRIYSASKARKPRRSKLHKLLTVARSTRAVQGGSR